MLAVKIAALCVAVALVTVSFRGQKPEIAMAVSLMCASVAAVLLLGQLEKPMQLLKRLLNETGGREEEVLSVLKMCGISLLSDQAALICKDAGENALAERVLLAARVSILLLTVPLFTELLNGLEALFP